MRSHHRWTEAARPRRTAKPRAMQIIGPSLGVSHTAHGNIHSWQLPVKPVCVSRGSGWPVRAARALACVGSTDLFATFTLALD